MENKQTILIVDDTKDNIDILINLLNNYDVIPALDGNTALEIIEEENIDLILLDIMMPIMDGFEVCKILKKNPKTVNIPIIFLTAKSDNEDIKIGFELGAVDYITKPFNPSELISRVKTHLELKSYQDILEEKVQQEMEKNRIKEQLLFQKSKQAEIGELLMHIAHQWKQPLSELGSINMYNTAKLKTLGTIDEDTLLDSFEKTATILDFMSDTIHTFQEYYKPNQKFSFFNIIDAINEAINIIDATYDFHNIKITIKKDDDIKIYGNKNEYSQVILSILNNAKDVFISRNTKNPTVNITIKSQDNQSIIIINDNGGGVRLKKRDDIFLPFISEKNSMGMGLYMAKNIIEKNNGSIHVTNKKDGAVFTITLLT